MCAATRHTHLEFVTSELTGCFLLALCKAVARKDLPSTFVTHCFKAFRAKHIKHFILNLIIHWKFMKNSPGREDSDRLTGIIKRCIINKVAVKVFLNHDELTTLLAEMEQTFIYSNIKSYAYLIEEENDEIITLFCLF